MPDSGNAAAASTVPSPPIWKMSIDGLGFSAAVTRLPIAYYVHAASVSSN